MCSKIANQATQATQKKYALLYVEQYLHCSMTDIRLNEDSSSGIAISPKKVKRICDYNPPQCLVFLSIPPDVFERDPRVGLARIFRTVTMGNFPRIYSTRQLSLYHSPFHRSPYLKAPPRLSHVFRTVNSEYFPELFVYASVLYINFLVSRSLLRLYR